MKNKGFLFVVLGVAIFLGVSFANAPPPSPRVTDTTSVPGQEPANQADIIETEDRGKLLYENHCTACHHQYVHTRISQKVLSVDDIRQWVIRWSNNLKLGWQDNDIELVADYLNRQFYRFPPSE